MFWQNREKRSVAAVRFTVEEGVGTFSLLSGTGLTSLRYNNLRIAVY